MDPYSDSGIRFREFGYDEYPTFLAPLNRRRSEFPYFPNREDLQLSSSKNSLDILDLLLMAKGETPLHLAATTGNDLILRGASRCRGGPDGTKWRQKYPVALYCRRVQESE
jgi:hypothetical protein